MCTLRTFTRLPEQSSYTSH